MRLSDFSIVTQRGLRTWAKVMWNDERALDCIQDLAPAWAWVWYVLREAEDRPEWFPRGKWSVIQMIERWLTEEARSLPHAHNIG